MNVTVGYGVAVTSQALLFPLFGLHAPLTTNMQIGACFTLISICRSYVLRRIFTRLTEKKP